MDELKERLAKMTFQELVDSLRPILDAYAFELRLRGLELRAGIYGTLTQLEEARKRDPIVSPKSTTDTNR